MSRATSSDRLLPGVCWDFLTHKYNFICRNPNCLKSFVKIVEWQKHKLKCYLLYSQLNNISVRHPFATNNSISGRGPGTSVNTKCILSKPKPLRSRAELLFVQSDKCQNATAVSINVKPLGVNEQSQCTSICSSSSKNKTITRKSKRIAKRIKLREMDMDTGTEILVSQMNSLEDRLTKQIEDAVFSIIEKDHNSLEDITPETNHKNDSVPDQLYKQTNNSDEQVVCSADDNMDSEPVVGFCNNDIQETYVYQEDSMEVLFIETEELNFVDIFGEGEDTIILQVMEYEPEGDENMISASTKQQGDNEDDDGQGKIETVNLTHNTNDIGEQQVDHDLELGAVETIDLISDIASTKGSLEIQPTSKELKASCSLEREVSNVENLKVALMDNVKCSKSKVKEKKQMQSKYKHSKKDHKRAPITPFRPLPSNPLFAKPVLDKTLLVCLRRCDDLIPLKIKHKTDVCSSVPPANTRTIPTITKAEEEIIESKRHIKSNKAVDKKESKKRKKEYKWDVICSSEENENIQKPLKLKIKRRRLEKHYKRKDLPEVKKEILEPMTDMMDLDAKLSQLYKKSVQPLTENAHPLILTSAERLLTNEDINSEKTSETLINNKNIIIPPTQNDSLTKKFKVNSDRDSGCGSSISSEGENYLEKCESLQNDLYQSSSTSHHAEEENDVLTRDATTTIKTTDNITIISYSPPKTSLSHATTPRTTCRTKASELAKKAKRKFFDGYCKICGAELQTSMTYYISNDPRKPYSCFTCHEAFSASKWEAHDKNCFVDEEIEVRREVVKGVNAYTNNLSDRNQEPMKIKTRPIFEVVKNRDLSCINCFKLLSRVV